MLYVFGKDFFSLSLSKNFKIYKRKKPIRILSYYCYYYSDFGSFPSEWQIRLSEWGETVTWNFASLPPPPSPPQPPPERRQTAACRINSSPSSTTAGSASATLRRFRYRLYGYNSRFFYFFYPFYLLFHCGK